MAANLEQMWADDPLAIVGGRGPSRRKYWAFGVLALCLVGASLAVVIGLTGGRHSAVQHSGPAVDQQYLRSVAGFDPSVTPGSLVGLATLTCHELKSGFDGTTLMGIMERSTEAKGMPATEAEALAPRILTGAVDFYCPRYRTAAGF